MLYPFFGSDKYSEHNTRTVSATKFTAPYIGEPYLYPKSLIDGIEQTLKRFAIEELIEWFTEQGTPRHLLIAERLKQISL